MEKSTNLDLHDTSDAKGTKGATDRAATIIKGQTVGEALGPNFLERALLARFAPPLSMSSTPPTVSPETLAQIRAGVKELIREVVREVMHEENAQNAPNAPEAQNGE